MHLSRFTTSAVALLLAVPALRAQDRLPSMPGAERYAMMAPRLATAIKSGAITPTWAEDGKSFEYTRDGKRFRFDVATRRLTDTPAASQACDSG